MSNQGRFGKYGEARRVQRLRQAGFRPPFREKPGNWAPGKPLSPGGRDQPGPSLAIRMAIEEDLDFIGKLSGRVFGVYGPYREMITRWFRSRAAVTLVAVAGKRPIGFVMVGPLPPTPGAAAAELLAIAVELRNRRKGVGRMLLEKIEVVASGPNVRQMSLHTARENRAARSLFARCGYLAAQVKPCFYPAGQDAVLMLKDLPDGRGFSY